MRTSSLSRLVTLLVSSCTWARIYCQLRVYYLVNYATVFFCQSRIYGLANHVSLTWSGARAPRANSLLRDPICTTWGPKVDCVRQVDFRWKGSPSTKLVHLEHAPQPSFIVDYVSMNWSITHLLVGHLPICQLVNHVSIDWSMTYVLIGQLRAYWLLHPRMHKFTSVSIYVEHAPQPSFICSCYHPNMHVSTQN